MVLKTAPPNATHTPNAPAPDGEAPGIKSRIRALLDEAGLVRSESWVRQVYRDYCRVSLSGTPLGLFIATRISLTAVERRQVAERADLRYLLSYADPTGETAVRNVMKEQARAH